MKNAWQHHLCILDWPDDIISPGPGFNLKNLATSALSRLVGGYIENVRNDNNDNPYPHIVSWSDGVYIKLS